MCQAQFYEQQQQWRADYWALAERRGIPGGEGGNGVFAKLFPKRGESDAAAAPEQADGHGECGRVRHITNEAAANIYPQTFQDRHGAAETMDGSGKGGYHAVPGRHGGLTPEESAAGITATPGFGGNDSRGVSEGMISGQELLDRFGTGRHRNGSDYFVKGDHFDQFENDYYASDDPSYTPYDTPVQRNISPGLIEGIRLGKGEVGDPAVFWGQHRKGETAESFQEIARHIPEVRARLAAGETLDDLARDDKLSACVGIYFRNMPEVIEWDGYYEFSSNGRHRILAARALGHDIPVKVIGKRSWHKTGK